MLTGSVKKHVKQAIPAYVILAVIVVLIAIVSPSFRKIGNIRRSCSSVSCLTGIRFRIQICNGRIFWCIARYSSITKIFSLSRISLAGRSLCILIGIFSLTFLPLCGASFE